MYGISMVLKCHCGEWLGGEKVKNYKVIVKKRLTIIAMQNTSFLLIMYYISIFIQKINHKIKIVF